MKYSLAVGLFVSLVFVAIHIGDGDNSLQMFYCFILGLAGILGSTVLDFLFEDHKTFRFFEFLFEEVFVFVYRVFTLIQACYIALRTPDLRLRWFVWIAVMCGVYGAVEVVYLTDQTERKIDLFHRRISDAVLGDLRRVLVLVTYSIVVFFVLIFSLARMRDRHWNRGGIIVVMLLVPMVFEVLFEVQFPLFGLFRFSSFQSISRMACYGLGSILFVLTFNPIINKLDTN
jgi:hypothetical protein